MKIPENAERFIRAQTVARLGTVDPDGRPHLVPIVFVYDAGLLYTPIDKKPKAVEVDRLRRVRNIRANPSVQVLLDHYDEDWSLLGYVQLRGRAELVEHGAEHTRVLGLLTRKYPQYGDLPLEGRPIIKIAVEEVVSWGAIEGASGRRRL